eukprot:9804015-Alexandrium_andersonii.AAC.1
MTNLLQTFEPGTPRAQEQPRKYSAQRVRADSRSTDESGDRGGPKSRDRTILGHHKQAPPAHACVADAAHER